MRRNAIVFLLTLIACTARGDVMPVLPAGCHYGDTTVVAGTPPTHWACTATNTWTQVGAAGTGAVDSFNARTGAVLPLQVDYDAFFQTQAESDTRYVNASGDTMTGTLLMPDGAVGTPSLSFSGDTNTGIYRIAVDTFGISAGGVLGLAVTSTGQVGIGVEPTFYALQLERAAGVASVLIHTEDSAEETALTLSTGNGNISSRDVRVTLTADELIDQTWTFGMSGTKNFGIRNDSAARADLTISDSGGVLIKQGLTTTGVTIEEASGTDTLKLWHDGTSGAIDATGGVYVPSKLGIGQANPQVALHARGSSFDATSMYFERSGSGTNDFAGLGIIRDNTSGDTDGLGTLNFQRADSGGVYDIGAAIRAYINGTPSDTALPTDLKFYTASASTTLTNASAPQLTIGPTGAATFASSVAIGGGAPIAQHLSNTASLNFGVLAASTCAVLTITVTGAADGDVVTLGVPNALADADGATERTSFFGWVSSANTVSVRRCNKTTASTVDPPAATVRADVWKH